MFESDEDCFYKFTALMILAEGKDFIQITDEYEYVLRQMERSRVEGVERFTAKTLKAKKSDQEFRDVWMERRPHIRYSDGHWRLIFKALHESAAKVLASPE